MEAEIRFGGRGASARPKKDSEQYREEYRRQQGTQGDALGLRSDIQRAYAILELRSTASEAEIKKAYRRLISRHHPDKLVSQGYGTESLQSATETTQKIQSAYDLICKLRGL